jgi:ribosomal protein L23
MSASSQERSSFDAGAARAGDFRKGNPGRRQERTSRVQVARDATKRKKAAVELLFKVEVSPFSPEPEGQAKRFGRSWAVATT